MISEESFKQFIKTGPMALVLLFLVAYGATGGLLVAGFCLLLAEAVRLMSPQGPGFVYVMYMATSSVVGLLFAVFALKPDDDPEFYAGGVSIAFGVMHSLLLLVLFGLFCREWSTDSPRTFTGVSDASRSAWIGFAVDNLLEAILLDIPSIYSLGLSEIRAERFSARTAVFLFRLFADFVLIATLFRTYRLFKQRRRKLV